MPTPPGGSEWLIILLIFVLLFGAKKLPELSRSVGQSITSFKKGVQEAHEEPEASEGGESSQAGTGDDRGSEPHDRDNA